MERPIRIAFENFWRGFDPRENYFLRLLRRRFVVELSDEPDFVIYSAFGKKRIGRYRCARVFYCGENIRPDFGECDFAFTFDHSSHERHFRLPLYALYDETAKLTEKFRESPDPLEGKTRFCNFIYSNPGCPTRNRFFELLSKYKQVDAGGKLFNNLGYRVGDKLAFMRQYKFTIAFENSSHPGYCTEKLVEPMAMGSAPIYWGDPKVGVDFDTRSFLNAHEFADLESLVEKVIEIDGDDAKYRALFQFPWVHENKLPECVDPEKILDRFEMIFAGGYTPVGRRRRSLFYSLGKVGRILKREASLVGQRWKRNWFKTRAA